MRYRHVRSIPTVIPLVVVGLFSASGCVEMVPAQKFQAVQLALQAAKERNWLLETQVSGQQEAIRTLSSQVANLADVDKGDPADIMIVP